MPVDPLAPVLHVTVEDGGTVVRFPAGTALTEANAGDVGRHLTALAGGGAGSDLTLDLGGVALLASVALEELIRLNGQVRADGGRLALVNPTPTVRRVFRVTRLDTILDIRDATEPPPG